MQNTTNVWTLLSQFLIKYRSFDNHDPALMIELCPPNGSPRLRIQPKPKCGRRRVKVVVLRVQCDLSTSSFFVVQSASALRRSLTCRLDRSIAARSFSVSGPSSIRKRRNIARPPLWRPRNHSSDRLQAQVALQIAGRDRT